MKTISEKINKYQIRLFINTLVKLPVVYLQQLKSRFDHFARETKKETDCYPNSNADLLCPAQALQMEHASENNSIPPSKPVLLPVHC